MPQPLRFRGSAATSFGIHSTKYRARVNFSNLTMRIERKPMLSPASGSLSPGLLCVEVVDRKLNAYIALGHEVWSLPHCFVHQQHSTGSVSIAATVAVPSTTKMSTPITSPVTATAPISRSGNRVAKTRFEPHHQQRQEVHGSIASRLPARSPATVHRQLRTAIARRLPPRTANRATYRRSRALANQSPDPVP